MKIETDHPKADFIQLVETTIAQGQFVKLTLSKPSKRDGSLAKNIYGRLVELKKGRALSCTLRFETKDITQNYTLDTALREALENWLGQDYLIATLLSSTEDIVLKYNKKRKARLERIAGQKRAAVVVEHNLVKQYAITEDRPFLQKLGVSNKDGKLLQGYQDKYKQINKYVEIMESLLQQANLLNQPKPLHIVDMGSGKGYLTFALFEFLKEGLQVPVEILGVELREQLTHFCNTQAKALGWQEQLRFAAMNILDYHGGDLDVLIALHACDTATDIAIAQGIKNGASLIVTAPCCHKQIRRAMHPKAPWKHILEQGILLERQAELITDSIRALLLELAGYKVKVFEFISSEHTAKNIMIAALKLSEPLSPQAQAARIAEINSLKEQFGIEQHYLETLLN